MLRARSVLGVIPLVLLAALAWWSVTMVSPPAPVPASAPADVFSAERARVHQERIGEQVHVAGSPAAAKVREYITDTLSGLGLSPQIQDAVGSTDALGGFAMARVQNVVAVIEGSASTGRLFLVAHYDSVQVSYGAGDDGAGVSTLLETARALRAGPAPRNDIVLVFTDAEEACLCGAEAFMSSHPLAAGGGVVLNFESRGSSGPAIMFETTRGNADLVGVYGSSVPYPVATSFAVEVYRILPNDTDFSPFRDAGRFTGLNAAYIDGSATYHTPQDRPEYQSVESLQHHGSNALALTKALGAADLAVLSKPSAGDATYFPVLGFLVRYPGGLVWPIAILALLAVAGAALLAVRRAVTSWARVAAGVGLGLIPLLAGVVAAQLFPMVLGWIRPAYGTMMDPWSPGWYRIAVVALVATVVVAWLALLRKRFGVTPLAIGGLMWLAVIGVAMAAVTPGGSYLAAIPALAGAVALAVGLNLSAVGAMVAQLLAGAVSVLILAPTVALFFPALGLELAAAAGLFATMLALALVQLLDGLFGEGFESRRIRRAAPGIVCLVVVLVAGGIGLAVDRFDAKHPVPVEMMYALDTDTGKAFWVRPGADPTGWSDAMVSRQQDLSAQFPLLGSDITVGDARPAELPAAKVMVLSDKRVEGRRELALRIVPQRAVRLVHLQLDAEVTAATAGGREVPVRGGFQLLFHAPPTQGLEVTVTISGTDPVKLRVIDGSDGLGGLPGFVPRPDGVGVRGSHTSELVLVAHSQTI